MNIPTSNGDGPLPPADLSDVVADYSCLHEVWNTFVDAEKGQGDACAPKVVSAKVTPLPPARMLVCGEVNAGKSTFINSLLEVELLPTALIACTSRITIIRSNEDGAATLWWIRLKTDASAGDPQPYSNARAVLEALKQLAAAADDATRATQLQDSGEVEVLVPKGVSPLLDSGLEIVDSPGMNEGEAAWRKVRTFMAANAIVLYLLSTEQGAMTAGPAAGLAAAYEAGVQPILVVNKVDAVSPNLDPDADEDTRTAEQRAYNEQMSNLVNKLQREFHAMFPDAVCCTNNFFALSARDAIRASRHGRPVPPPYQRMKASIATVAASQLRDLAIACAKMSVLSVISYFDTTQKKRGQLESAIRHLARAIECIETHLQEFEESLKSAVDRAFELTVPTAEFLNSVKIAAGANDAQSLENFLKDCEVFDHLCAFPRPDVTQEYSKMQLVAGNMAQRLNHTTLAAVRDALLEPLTVMERQVQSEIEELVAAVGMPVWAAHLNVIGGEQFLRIIGGIEERQRSFAVLLRVVAGILTFLLYKRPAFYFPLIANGGWFGPMSEKQRWIIIAIEVCAAFRGAKREWVEEVLDGPNSQLHRLVESLENARKIAETQLIEGLQQRNLTREEFLLNHFARIAPALARVEHGAVAIDTSGSQPLRGNQWGPVYPLRTAFGDARFAQVIDVSRRPNLIRYLLRIADNVAGTGLTVGRTENEVFVLLKSYEDLRPNYTQADDILDGNPDRPLTNCLGQCQLITTEEDLTRSVSILMGGCAEATMLVNDAVQLHQRAEARIQREAETFLERPNDFRDPRFRIGLVACTVYTEEGVPGRPNLYGTLNRMLRSGERKRKEEFLRKCGAFLRTFIETLKGVKKVPFGAILFRGVNCVIPDYKSKLRPGNTVYWYTITSCSHSRVEAEIMALKSPPEGRGTLFIIHSIEAYPIKWLSEWPSEEESVMLPGSKFKCQSIDNTSRKDLIIITIQQEASDAMFL